MPRDAGRLRVLHVMGRLEPHGTERQLVGMLRAAHARHWDAHLCVLRSGSPLVAEVRAAGVPVDELGHAADGDPRRLSALRRLVARTRPDVVHASLWGASACTRLALLGPGQPAFVVSERSVEDARPQPARWLDRALRGVTDAWIGNSRDVADFVERAHRAPPDRVTVVRNGLDDRVFHPGPDVRQDGRALRLGTVGRLERVKGHDVLLAALPRVLEGAGRVGLRVEVEVVGEGPERAALQAAADGLPARLRGELRAADQVADFLRSLDVFVMPSRWEGLPNAVLEAVACGIPVVATAVPGMAEAAGPGARLVPADDPVALADALLAALVAGPAPDRPPPVARGYDDVAAEHLAVFEAARAHRDRRARAAVPPGPPAPPGQGDER